MSLGAEVFLRPDGPCDEPLHRGTILDGGGCTVALAGQGLRPRAGQQVLVHYEQDGEFTRRAAIVVAVEGSVVQLRLHGVAESAERRRVQRVSYLQVLGQVVKEPLTQLVAVTEDADPLDGNERPGVHAGTRRAALHRLPPAL